MTDTAERLMDLAEAHIRESGYGGFSFRELAAEIGIKSASVHHHFPTKSSMTEAVVRRYADRFFILVAPVPGEGPRDAVEAYRAAFRADLERDGLMCLCGVLGAETGALSPEVSGATESFFTRCIEDLAGRLPGPDAEARAFQIMAALEGGMMLARTCRSTEVFEKATANLSLFAGPATA